MIITTKRVLIIVLIIQILFGLVLILDLVGLSLPILRFILGFVYLTFVPGILIMGILGFARFDLENLLYLVGLSISFLMFTGFMLNIFLPAFGIEKPITLLSLSITIYILITIFLIAFCKRNTTFKIEIKLQDIFSKLTLLLLLLLVLVGIGAYMFLYHNNNLLLLFILSAIATITVYAGIRARYRLYPIVIWFISLTLLLYGSLRSKYVVVIGDPHVEYYFANLVRIMGIWNPHLEGTHNAMLEVVMLQPIYSILLDLDLTWTFKIVYPLLFSFCPLTIYLIYKYQFNDRIAFFSILIFIFSFQFYNGYANGTRWGISLFFISLIVLIIVSDRLTSPKKDLLLVVFSLSLITSHYTSSYIFMFTLIFVSIIYTICKIEAKPSRSFALFYLVSTVGYYMYVSLATPYKLMFNYFRYVAKTIREEILSTEITYLGYAIKKQWPISVEVTMFFIYIFIFLSFVGTILTIYKLKFNREKLNLHPFYLIGALLSYLYIFVSIFGMFGPPRAFFMSLLFTSPFTLIAWLDTFKRIQKILIKNDNNSFIYLILMFNLILYFLFSSGFVSEVITRDGDYSPTIFISKNRAEEIGDPYFIIALARNYVGDKDVISAIWLSKYRDHEKKIYVDAGTGYGHAGWLTLQSYGMIERKGNIQLLTSDIEFVKSYYIYLREYNVKKGLLFQGLPVRSYDITIAGIQKINKIYSNGGSEIYYK